MGIALTPSYTTWFPDNVSVTINGYVQRTFLVP
jgi:hypothetical protein